MFRSSDEGSEVSIRGRYLMVRWYCDDLLIRGGTIFHAQLLVPIHQDKADAAVYRNKVVSLSLACDLSDAFVQANPAAGRHLLMLINDVLDLSKIEAGRVELFSEPAQVGTLVNDIVSTIEPLARKNKNVFLSSAEDANATIYVDVTKFRQCLLNLLSNACKFTEGGIVRLRVEERARNGDIWSCWEVSDTGIGIADSDQAKLFQAFSQVDSSATRRHGGTGLGLAISQRLTRMMGGWIECETQLGRGSTFTIYLPRVAEGEVARTTAVARVA